MNGCAILEKVAVGSTVPIGPVSLISATTTCSMVNPEVCFRVEAKFAPMADMRARSSYLRVRLRK